MIDYIIRKFRPETDTAKPFDCGNSDLNGFLLETCTKEPNATLSEKELWNKLSREIPNAKRRSSYPALKIGKLAVNQTIKSHGLGTQIINFVEWSYLKDQHAGCRFITVDALREAENFYSKNFFKRLVNPEPEDDTVLMYFDLKSLLW